MKFDGVTVPNNKKFAELNRVNVNCIIYELYDAYDSWTETLASHNKFLRSIVQSQKLKKFQLITEIISALLILTV